LESVEIFDVDVVVAYALRLGSALTVARRLLSLPAQ